MLRISLLVLFVAFQNIGFSQLIWSDWYNDLHEATLNPVAVKKLTVQNMGKFPTCLSQFVHLEEFTIYGNDVDYELNHIPDHFYALSSLRIIKIFNTNIHQFSPKIKNLKQLEEISVDFILDAEIGELPNLKIVEARRLPDSIGENKLENIRKLTISEYDYYKDNGKTFHHAPQWIYQLKNLEEINLFTLPDLNANNNIVWPNLRTLVTTIPNDSVLSQLHHITSLKIGNCRSYSKLPSYFSSFSSLKKLELLNLPTNMDFWSFFQTLSQLENLEELHLLFNSYTNALPAVNQLREIKEYYAKENKFFPSLKILEANGTETLENAFLSVFENTQLETCNINSHNSIPPPRVKKIYFNEYYHRYTNGSDSHYPLKSFQSQVEDITIDFRFYDKLDSIPMIHAANLKRIKITLDNLFKIQNFTEQLDRLMQNLSEIGTLENIEIILENKTTMGVPYIQDSLILRHRFPKLKSFKLIDSHTTLYLPADFDQLLPQIDTLVATIHNSNRNQQISSRELVFCMPGEYSYSRHNYLISSFSWNRNPEKNWTNVAFPKMKKTIEKAQFFNSTEWSKYVDFVNYGDWETDRPKAIEPCHPQQKIEKYSINGENNPNCTLENRRYENGLLKKQITQFNNNEHRTYFWDKEGKLTRVKTVSNHKSVVYKINSKGYISLVRR